MSFLDWKLHTIEYNGEISQSFITVREAMNSDKRIIYESTELLVTFDKTLKIQETYYISK